LCKKIDNFFTKITAFFRIFLQINLFTPQIAISEIAKQHVKQQQQTHTTATQQHNQKEQDKTNNTNRKEHKTGRKMGQKETKGAHKGHKGEHKGTREEREGAKAGLFSAAGGGAAGFVAE